MMVGVVAAGAIFANLIDSLGIVILELLYFPWKKNRGWSCSVCRNRPTACSPATATSKTVYGPAPISGRNWPDRSKPHPFSSPTPWSSTTRNNPYFGYTPTRQAESRPTPTFLSKIS